MTKPLPSKGEIECKCAENLEECLSCANDQHDEHCQVQYRIKTGSIEPKEWGERFNEEFVEYVGTRNGLEYIKGKVRGNDIKQFISSLLKEQRTELIEEIRAKLVHPNSPNYNDYWKYLDDFLDSLERKK